MQLLAKAKRFGKINPKFLRALLKVVIDDIEYEKYSVTEYIEYLEENIARLQEIDSYYQKREKAKSEKDKKFYENGIHILLRPGESMDNYATILQQYQDAKVVRSQILVKLDQEIKKIKKMKI